MTRIVAMLMLFTMAGGCARSGQGGATYTTVAFADLMRDPRSFDGKRIRVTGHMIRLLGSTLIDPEQKQCYSEGMGKGYVVTDLPFDTFGVKAARGDGLENDGRLITIQGRFDYSDRPWPRQNVTEPPEERAVGVLKEATVQRFLDGQCS